LVLKQTRHGDSTNQAGLRINHRDRCPEGLRETALAGSGAKSQKKGISGYYHRWANHRAASKHGRSTRATEVRELSDSTPYIVSQRKTNSQTMLMRYASSLYSCKVSYLHQIKQNENKIKLEIK
jgi:hypothetical protein